MYFHMPQERIQLPLLRIAGADIAFVDNFNFLGIIINKHLNWTSHVDMLTAKLSKTISILNTLIRVMPINIMSTMYNSLIFWHLNYGVLLWAPKLHVNDTLHILQKRLFEFTVILLTPQLHLLKTCDIYKCQLLTFIFKLIHKQYRIISDNLHLETSSIITPPEHVNTYLYWYGQLDGHQPLVV